MTPPNMVNFCLLRGNIKINSPISILINSLLNADIIRWLELSSMTSGFEVKNLLWQKIQSLPKKVHLSSKCDCLVNWHQKRIVLVLLDNKSYKI